MPNWAAPQVMLANASESTVALFFMIVAGRTALPAPRHTTTGAWPSVGIESPATAAAAVAEPAARDDHVDVAAVGHVAGPRLADAAVQLVRAGHSPPPG